VQCKWLPDRGLLLLLYSDALLVYDADLGTVLERLPLPRRCMPFLRWIAVEGKAHCVGTAAEGGLSTLVCEHEVCPPMADINSR
jgi:hypothetical protein